MRLREGCPYEKGDHWEKHLPCGERYIRNEGEEIHSYTLGQVIVWEICYGESMFVGPGLVRDGNPARELLASTRYGKASRRVWYIKPCLECPEADWNYLASVVNERLGGLRSQGRC